MTTTQYQLACLALGLSALLGACTSGGTGSATPGAAARATPPAVGLLQDGTCAASERSTAATIELGISECDLVRLKAAKPDDVLIGESGKGQREAQVLYAEPGGRELYLFTDNKLTKIVKPGQG